MDQRTEPVESLSELPRETREFLSGLTRDDIDTLRTGLPVIRMVMDFGKVSKWIILSLMGLFLGAVMLGESVLKVIAWLKPPPH